MNGMQINTKKLKKKSKKTNQVIYNIFKKTISPLKNKK